MSTTIIENEYATVWYHDASKIVHHQFHQPLSGQPLRDALDQAVDIFQEYGAQKWLSDDRVRTALMPEDGEWAMNDWQPRAIAAGWKFWAIVMPLKVIGQMNMEYNMQKGKEGGIVVQAFSDPDDAYRWLESL